MKEETVPISQLKTPSLNVRIHNDHQIREMVKSLERFGQIRPLVVDEDYTIWIGNGLVKALERAEYDKAKVWVINGMTDQDKYKMMMSDNKIFDLGADDIDAIYEIIASLDDYEVPGFDPEVLETLSYTEEEATDFAVDYGLMDDEQVAQKQNIIEHRQNKEARRSGDGEAIIEDEGEASFVYCPHCGGMVWL